MIAQDGSGNSKGKGRDTNRNLRSQLATRVEKCRPSNWKRKDCKGLGKSDSGPSTAAWEMTAESVDGRTPGLSVAGTERLTGAGMTWAYLFQGLIVDKAGSIFGHLKLTLLDLLAKLPIGECE
jgi:hypothetical protein